MYAQVLQERDTLASQQERELNRNKGKHGAGSRQEESRTSQAGVADSERLLEKEILMSLQNERDALRAQVRQLSQLLRATAEQERIYAQRAAVKEQAQLLLSAPASSQMSHSPQAANVEAGGVGLSQTHVQQLLVEAAIHGQDFSPEEFAAHLIDEARRHGEQLESCGNWKEEARVVQDEHAESLSDKFASDSEAESLVFDQVRALFEIFALLSQKMCRSGDQLPHCQVAEQSLTGEIDTPGASSGAFEPAREGCDADQSCSRGRRD